MNEMFKELVFRTIIGGVDETTDHIAWKLRSEGIYVAPSITQSNFCLVPYPRQEKDIILFDPECPFNGEKALQLLTGAGLAWPTYKDSFGFIRQYWKKMKEQRMCIFFPHRPLKDGRSGAFSHHVLCFDSRKERASFRLEHFDIIQDNVFFIAGVGQEKVFPTPAA